MARAVMPKGVSKGKREATTNFRIRERKTKIKRALRAATMGTATAMA